MSLAPPVTRVGLAWLLVAQALTILPLLGYLPWWCVGLWLFCAAWRIRILRMGAGFPGRLLKTALVLLVALAVWLSRGGLVGLDAGVVLLVAVFTIKLVELRSRRDALVLVFLGFFVVLTGYLFEDGPLAALYSLLPVSALLAALIGLQQSAQRQRPWPTLRLAAGMLLQALPLMLLLFIFFPRLGPLWSLPQPSDKAVSGLADNMTPADIAELSRSTELAFRVTFDAAPPEQSALYWRALTLDQFDGRRWSQSAPVAVGTAPEWHRQGPRIDYQVIMQPTRQRWLFALDVATSDLPGSYQAADFRLQQRRPSHSPLHYRASSWPEAVRQPQLPPPLLRQSLQLPAQGDPRSRAWARQLAARHPDPERRVAAVLEHFRQQPYRYTLRPSTLGADSIDEFLFDTRSGFCAHYAGAMVFVLRASGVPARVVAGYQGGEWNAAAGYLQVRQFDAHAWIEYWREGAGWNSVDPTFAVAPERIEQGLEQALAGEHSFLEDSPLSLLRYRQVGWLNRLRLAWDGLNHDWQRWVLGYQGERQLQVLDGWFGRIDWRDLALALVGGGGLLLAGLALYLFRPWRRRADPLGRFGQRFERLLAGQGLRRQPGEGWHSFAERACQALPRQAPAIRQFASAFEAQRYAGEAFAPALLRQALRRLRRTLRWNFL